VSWFYPLLPFLFSFQLVNDLSIFFPTTKGYALSARDYYLRYGAIALARQVESAHPSLADFQGVPSRYPSYPLPSSISKPSGDPIRADKSDGSSKSTSFRSDTTIASAHQDSKLASTLDNLTFVRASLVIASEKNPKQAVTHLLRLLLQLCRTLSSLPSSHPLAGTHPRSFGFL
jgi:hypothetical protein